MKKIILYIVTFCCLLAPAVASAQFTSALQKLDSAAGNTGLTADFETSLSKIITTALSLVGTIFLGLTIYAGILWMTASGEEDKITKAKSILTAAIIGLAITMMAYAITAFVTKGLTTGS